MRHFCSFAGAALLFGIVAAACNGIAGIDDLAGPECLDPSDCASAGECTQVSCTEGLCAYTIAEAESPCAQGECDERGVCVECITDVPCARDPQSYLRHCNASTRKCVECTGDQSCPSDAPLCIDAICLPCGPNAPCPLKEICSLTLRRCVKCETSANCPRDDLPNEQCWSFVCAEGECVSTPLAGTECEGGECSTSGVCIPK